MILRATGELHARDAADAAHHLAKEQKRRRDDDEADQRHDRILHHHDGDKADERQQIAADRGDQQIDDLARPQLRQPSGGR